MSIKSLMITLAGKLDKSGSSKTTQLQGDQAAWAQPGQAKDELMLWSQQEVWLKLLGHPVESDWKRNFHFSAKTECLALKNAEYTWH